MRLKRLSVIEQIQGAGNSALADVRRVSTTEQFTRTNQGTLEMTATGEVRSGTIGCFMAGTLVHTREGLVPIEKIQVGDWVLSQPEEQGERAYKRVVKTFSFDDKEIFLVRFHKVGGVVDESMTIESVAVTGNHPFWVEGQGWTRADLLSFGDRLELPDGSHVSVVCASRVFLTAEADVGWVFGGWGIEMNDGSGNRVDLRNGSISVDFDGSFNFEAFDDPDQSALKAKVFNFEVEDFHTYYIGAMGAWVHNTNCRDLGVAFADSSVNLRPNPNTWVFVAGDSLSRNLPGPNRGVILTQEKQRQKPGAGNFERATEGALFSRDGFSVSWALRYDNTVNGGLNYIKLGDGRVLTPDGRLTNTFIDAKSGDKFYLRMFQDSFGENVLQPQMRENMQRLSKALEDNPGYQQIIESNSSR